MPDEKQTSLDAQKSELFERTPIPRVVMKMAVPTVLSSLVMVIYNLADTYFVELLNVTGMTALNNFTAAYGSTAVAAMGIAQKISMIPMYITMGISQGLMPLVGYNRGMCIGLVSLSIDFLAVGVFQACGMGTSSLVFAILRKIVLEIPALFILNRLWPLYGLAYAQTCAEFVLAIAAAVLLRKMFREGNTVK